MEQFLNDILFTKLLFFLFFLRTNPSITTKPAYIFPIFFLYYSIFYSHRAFEHVKNADQRSLRKFARG